MTSNAPSTLNELVAPLSGDEFLSLLRERKLTLVKGAVSTAQRYASLLGWDALLEMIESGNYPRGLNDVRLLRESATVPPERWLSKSKTENRNIVDRAKVEKYMLDGFSLLVMPIEHHVPALTVLCDQIRAQLAEQIKAGVIVSTGPGGAIKLHYDPEDLIILQVEGSKRWQVYGPAVSNPVAGMPKQEPPEEVSPLLDEVLEAGDMLFLPAGYWHHCQNGPARSLHLGIFFVPPTAWNAIGAIFSQLVADEVFRMPLTRMGDAAELAQLEARVKSRLAERVDQLKLDGSFFARHAGGYGGKGEPILERQQKAAS